MRSAHLDNKPSPCVLFFLSLEISDHVSFYRVFPYSYLVIIILRETPIKSKGGMSSSFVNVMTNATISEKERTIFLGRTKASKSKDDDIYFADFFSEASPVA